MNCKKCGNNMADGARFCISCGAEHDANGQLVIKNNKMDYDRTIMINNVSSNSNNKIDYNKTMMANDIPQNNKVDYNKTMMANDVSQSNRVDYNKTMMANDVSQINNNQKINYNTKSNVKNKKSSPIIIICAIVIVLVIVIFVFLFIKKKNVIKNSSIETSLVIDSIVETTKVITEETTGNKVTDFDATNGYWSKDAEKFYRNGTMQTNQWIGDFYVGSDGRKVRNKLIDDTFYVDANGKKVKNEWYKFTKNVGGSNVIVWYYLGEDGAKLRDTLTPDGYYVDKDGIYIPGKYELPNSDKYIPSEN